MSSLSGQYRERTIQELYKRSACSVLRRLSLLFPTDRCTHSNFRASSQERKEKRQVDCIMCLRTVSSFLFGTTTTLATLASQIDDL